MSGNDSKIQIDHNALYKELLTNFFIEFLALFMPQVLEYLDTESLEFLDKELIAEEIFGDSRRVDVLVRAKLKNEEGFFVIHVEHQAQAQSEFERRMFEYFIRLYLKYQVKIYPIALLSYDTPNIAAPNQFSMTFPDMQVFVLNYKVVQLNQLYWQDYLLRSNPIASALMSKMQVTEADRVKVKLESIRMLLGIKPLSFDQRRFLSAFVDTYLELSQPQQVEFNQQLKKIKPKERTQIMKLTTSWKREGIAEGIAEGQQELILSQLEYKLGGVSSNIVERITALPTPQLTALGKALLDFTNLADLEGWLNANPTTHKSQS